MKRPISLNQRILLSASALLVLFIGLATLALDRAFYDNARSAREQRLQAQLYLIIAATEVDRRGQLTVPVSLAEPRFNLPGSGLYAAIRDAHGQVVWQSGSTLGSKAPQSTPLAAGQQQFSQQANFFVQGMGIRWLVNEQAYGFTISVSEDLTEFNQQINQYRRNLWGWLSALALLLLLAQLLVLHWGLKPLRRVEQELDHIEAGQQDQLQGDYPREIQRLSSRLNSLIQHERAQQLRYRNGLGDLAHSLKTPLAVMRGALSESSNMLRLTVDEQVTQMDKIVAYQLQRAATAGLNNPMRAAQPLLPLVQKISAALNKVHADKQIQFEITIPTELCWHGDEGDLTELLGNLIDNASKWCRHQVHISAQQQNKQLLIQVGDDGPGIPPAQQQAILQRGVRADELVPGHGIGLAIVRDIVSAYQGEIHIKQSPVGGALFEIQFNKFE